MEFDVALSDDDPFDDRLDDLPTFLGGEGGPAGEKVTGFGQDFVTGQELDLPEATSSWSTGSSFSI